MRPDTLRMDLSSALKDCVVSFLTSQGEEWRGELRHLTRHEAVFDLYNLPHSSVIQVSEVLTDFKIYVQDRVAYGGRAVIKSLINTGLAVTCDVILEESWKDVKLLETTPAKDIEDQYHKFFGEWQKNYRIQPEFKAVVGDIQTYLMDLRIWLEQLELAIKEAPGLDEASRESEILDRLEPMCLHDLDILFDKYEAVASTIDTDLQPAHQHYMKRQLHPLVLCAPFAYRTFFKPLGYAGDYEMVDMIARQSWEGETLFARIVHQWFRKQGPAEAHRNRIEFLTQRIIDEIARTSTGQRRTRILNLGCGPAVEIQRIIEQSPLADRMDLTLLDFNEETIQHAATILRELKRKHERHTPIHIAKKSVQQVLREAGRQRADAPQYDFVYCAGLFDYLSDAVCERLISVFFNWVAPDGLLLVTNVDHSNPRRHTMESILEWNLIYRNAADTRKIIPEKIPEDAVTVHTELSGVNIIVEIRKPGVDHG